MSDALDVLRTASVGGIGLAALLALAAMTAVALGWAVLLRTTKTSASAAGIVAWYFVGEITKYIPGGIWALVGRGELVGQEIGRRPAYRSVTASLVLLFGVASVPTAVAVLRFDGWPLAARVVCALGLLCVLPAVYWRLRTKATEFAAVVVRYSAAWLLIGLTTYVVARSLDLSVGLLDSVVVTSAAWFVGFAVVFVPGGVGVREATFVALAPSSLDPSESLAIALVARLLFVLADTVGAVVGLALRPTRHRDEGPR